MNNCHMHAHYKESECLRCKIIESEIEIEDLYKAVTELREGLQEIFALRGEDELIEKIASPLIDKTRGLV
ncbi:MAG: hypothetical protein OQL19_16600 [Gammaproteobacteria bacterium]|nr:hypothetical protein [Gammaproteobacteria bacterium]